MNISHLFVGIKKPNRKRLARGIAGAGGKTAGRGTKGQKARSGSGRKVQEWFAGGQTPLYRRLAKKRGFNHSVVKTIAITTGTLEQFYKSGETVSPQTILEKGIVRRLKRGQGIKIIRRGDLKSKVMFEDVALSWATKK